MKLIDDATVRRLLDPAAAREAVDRALRHFADGQAAVQARVRTVAGPVKLSTMAAVDLGGRVAGAKVYTTIAGRFRFVVLLFDAESGAPLAVLESDAMTEVRTAAVTAVAARALARADADTLAVFGTGIQAGSHVRALAGALPVRQVRVVSRGDARDFCRRMAEATGLPVEQAGTRAALDGAGLVVTATRSATPLFGLDQLAPGAFVAAVGSTLPGHAEIGAADERTVVRFKGRPAVAVGMVKQATANPLELSAGVRAMLHTLKADLPADITIDIANDTLYGLGAGVWSRDGNRAYRMGRGIQAGRVWTNCYHMYPAHAAFGGYKQSGIGRETHKMMLDHYQQTKNLLVSYSPKALGFF